MENTPSAPKPVSLAELDEITCSFSEHRKLGGGAYGIVYLGEHKDGEKIAVKVLQDVLDLDDEKFEKEYQNLASLHHKNVVRLVSYCNETKGEYVQFNGKLVVAEKIWRVLCFEYMCKGSLDKFIFDEANERNWSTRYAIIKGICQGLEYLHEKLNPPMYHLDLKPANILLDESMSPKIADFGLSRLFIEQRTKQTNSSLGTRGYIPPEYIDAGLISIKFDIFSLGVVIIKMMTGQDGYFRPAEISSQQFADDVHTDWMNRLQGMSMNVYSIQVRRCIEIALSCVEPGRNKRPSIGVIIKNLCRTESIIQILDALRNSWTSQADICPCISNETEMLDILENNMKSYPLRVTDNRGRVHQATITTIGDPACDTSTSEPIRAKIAIIDCTGDLGYSQKWEENFGYVCTVDVHPTEPWILVGHYSGHVSAWNHRTQKILMGLRIVNTGERTISAVRFIPHKQWFVAGDSNGHIHVCITAPDNVKKFQAHASCINSLAVHPIDPFVLSSSDDHLIKLWNWENEECIRTFQAHSREVESVKFNPLTTSNTFASASRDGTIKIWSIHSDTPITTLECEAELTSVHYLSLPGSHQHIVTGSSCGTARIWDLEEETCIQNINGLQKEWCAVAVVDCLPRYPIFVTVSEDHIVSCCNSSTHRYQNLVDFKLGLIMDFAYIKDTKSLLVAGQRGIALMKID